MTDSKLSDIIYGPMLIGVAKNHFTRKPTYMISNFDDDAVHHALAVPFHKKLVSKSCYSMIEILNGRIGMLRYPIYGALLWKSEWYYCKDSASGEFNGK